eukprot:scaffold339242_cov16-Prasinocladus_malaysianus.AAC.1
MDSTRDGAYLEPPLVQPAHNNRLIWILQDSARNFLLSNSGSFPIRSHKAGEGSSASTFTKCGSPIVPRSYVPKEKSDEGKKSQRSCITCA